MHPTPKVGDRLLAVPAGFRDLERATPTTRIVVRVGRKYLYANESGDPEHLTERYFLDSGHPAEDVGRPLRVLTPTQWDDEVAAHKIALTLRGYGWETRRSLPSAATLRTMLAALEADEKGQADH